MPIASPSLKASYVSTACMRLSVPCAAGRPTGQGSGSETIPCATAGCPCPSKARPRVGDVITTSIITGREVTWVTEVRVNGAIAWTGRLRVEPGEHLIWQDGAPVVEFAAGSAHIRRTVVCRNQIDLTPKREPIYCKGGGWWGDTVPSRCPRCGGELTDLAPTMVIPIGPTLTISSQAPD